MQDLMIDGRAYSLAFAGFDRPLRVQRAGSRAEVVLSVWPCSRHLSSLRQHLHVVGGSLALDRDGFADSVLDWSRVPDTERDGLRPLALWWARGMSPETSGAELARGQDSLAFDDDGWTVLRPGLRARLRVWTWGEKLAAQRACLHRPGFEQASPEPDQEQGREFDFDPVGYLERMLEACVTAVDGGDEAPRTRGSLAPGDGLTANLDAEATRQLLAAVTALNHPDSVIDPLSDSSPAMAAATLRVCAVLGWTPGQVWATPAPDIDRLLALMNIVEEGPDARGLSNRSARSSSPRRAHRPTRPTRIADHPDAVVIVFGDDDDELDGERGGGQ